MAFQTLNIQRDKIARNKEGVIIIRRKKRFAALALLFCFIVVSPLAAKFISTHAGHDCSESYDYSGEPCSICVKINNAGNLLKQIREAASIIFLAGAGLFAVTIARNKLSLFGNYLSTLVAVKARMNN